MIYGSKSYTRSHSMFGIESCIFDVVIESAHYDFWGKCMHGLNLINNIRKANLNMVEDGALYQSVIIELTNSLAENLHS